MPRKAPSPQWARVRIHLNLGEIADATAVACEHVATLKWSPSRGLCLGRAVIFGCADLPVGWAYFDVDLMIAVLNDAIVDEFSLGLSMFEFCDVIDTIDESGFRRYDVANWRVLEAMDDAAADAAGD